MDALHQIADLGGDPAVSTADFGRLIAGDGLLSFRRGL
jgi:hypothetical protein